MHRSILLFFLFMSNLAFSQVSEKMTDLYYEGNGYIMSEEYIEALPIFLELNEMKQNANMDYKIGECYLHLPNQKHKSIPYLEKAVQHVRSSYDPADPSEEHAPLKALLYLGRAYRITTQLDKAIQVLSALSDSVAGGNKEVIDAVAWEIQVCENARLFLESPVSYDSVHLGTSINDHFSNYNAVITNDEQKLYFMNALKFYDAVMESFKEYGQWSNADNITMKLKSDGDFYITDVSADGKKLIFHFYNILSMGDLYESNYVDGAWEPITKLKGEINGKFNETHASISRDGQTMYFTSNRPGGNGGLDIYTCQLNDSGEWINPVNLGKIINTSKNEDTPFITKDGKKIFFASEGHFNMGEYDVFKAHLLEDGSWSKPRNIGYPVNNTDNNLFYYPHDDGETLYFSTYSPNGEGQRDIYKYSDITEPHLRKFKLHATIENDSKAEDQPEITIDLYRAGEVYQSIDIDNNTLNTRIHAGEYTIIASAEGFSSDTTMITLKNDLDNLNIPVALNLIPHDVQLSEEEKAKTIEIRNIYFGFDSKLLSDDDKAYLDRFYQEINNLNVMVEVTGFSDSKGPDAYNRELSEKRAHAVAYYLKNKGFPDDNLITKGMGERHPLTSNTDESGNDNPTGRKYNRRVELNLRNLPSNVKVNKQLDIPAELLLKK